MLAILLSSNNLCAVRRPFFFNASSSALISNNFCDALSASLPESSITFSASSSGAKSLSLFRKFSSSANLLFKLLSSSRIKFEAVNKALTLNNSSPLKTPLVLAALNSGVTSSRFEFMLKSAPFASSKFTNSFNKLKRLTSLSKSSAVIKFSSA